MDRDQQSRAMALSQLLEGRLSTSEVATALGISVRHVERLRPRFRAEGPAALVHGNTGRRPDNRIPEEQKQRIVELAAGKYRGFNFEHLAEMLDEFEDVHVSADTVRRFCLEAGIKPPKQRRRSAKRYERRERCAQAGEMVQFDGSKHDWLEGRGPKLVLINAIDDATNRKWGLFCEEETLAGYSSVLKLVIGECGVPLAAYHDGLSTVGGKQGYSKVKAGKSQAQLKRAYDELGVVCIIARSPQAKGRVERTNGLDQDRLCSILRLHNASSLTEANTVLKDYLRQVNRRFMRAPTNPVPAWLPRPKLHLDDVFCIKEERVVSGDNTVKVYGQVLDIPAGSPRRNYSGFRVQIHRRFDRTIGVFHEGRRIGGTPARNISPPTKSLRS